MKDFVFRRKNLASAYCDSLSGEGITDARSGLFLAGPRRIGKSTFLLQDLMPEAQARGWEVVYVDLWENKLADPATLIQKALKNKLSEQKRGLAKLAEQVRLQKLSLLDSLEFDFSKQAFDESFDLLAALKQLIRVSDKPVLLMIDEAQHALTSKAGMNLMFALKSARDQLNTPNDEPQLMLCLTGSNRDKLGQLVLKRDQPFFGSEITLFPFLGRQYSDFFTDKVNIALASSNQFSKESVWVAFQTLGFKPEALRQIVGRIALNNDAGNLEASLQEETRLWQEQCWQEFQNDYTGLPKLAKALLVTLIEQGKEWAPFSDSAMKAYLAFTGLEKVSASSVQSALQLLRERGFIWQSGRGGYALEDAEFASWYCRSRQ